MVPEQSGRKSGGKGVQNGSEKVGVFLTGTMNFIFSLTGQISMKFRQKTSMDVLLY